ncbi:MAG: hypothetical protein GY903_10700 [Fuerstiella sp.]|nr:hypothetical protein [Fuerstiella sp.]MCP4854948.1 hypothetical protein [Fuerstiella sp.]
MGLVRSRQVPVHSMLEQPVHSMLEQLVHNMMRRLVHSMMAQEHMSRNWIS